MVGPVTEKVKAGKADEFGTTALNVYWSDGETFFLAMRPTPTLFTRPTRPSASLWAKARSAK
jgi:hypothetical protein